MMTINKEVIDDIVSKLRRMRLPALAEAFVEQINSPELFKEATFADRLSLLVDAEYDSEKVHRIERMIKNAKFALPKASLCKLENIPERHLPMDLIQVLSTNKYIENNVNVIIMGATGSGKTFLACALGVNACEDGYKTQYVRLPALLREFDTAKKNGNYEKVIDKYHKVPLLIIDEFLLVPVSDIQQTDLLELMEARYGCTSTIFCSQYAPKGWIDKLTNKVLAESIIDRIDPLSYKISIMGEQSMRKRKASLVL